MRSTSKFVLIIALLANIAFTTTILGAQESTLAGRWLASLQSPGGSLDFGVEFVETDDGYSCFLINGPERIKIPIVKFDGRQGEINIAHFDSRIDFEIGDDKKTLTGQWTKRRGVEKWSRLPFHANRKFESTSSENQQELDSYVGRWLVHFKSDSDPVVAIFKKDEKNRRIVGTFMTTTGDYRYLDGVIDGDKLRLSCFDGAHAFLFHTRMQADGTITGDFWSSDSWHDTWTGKRDDEAKLPDAFMQTQQTDNANLGQLSFPDLDGTPTRLDDPKFEGKARLIYVFGSWCPNCHDAATYFAELQKKYEGQGLSILGLAFEHTGDFERDAQQVRRYLERHGSTYPVLVAGLSDKAEASTAVAFLDRVRSYPTTVFVDSQNKIRAIHTGFTGPATGDEYAELKIKFESLIDQMIREAN